MIPATKRTRIFRKRLREAGVAPAQISHLLLTHHHDDHCGLLHDVLAENSAVRVVMSAACRDLISAGENDRTHGGGYLNRRVAFFLGLFKRILRKQDADGAASFAFPPYFARENDILVEGDTRLSDLGIPLDGAILMTPGHTVDSVSVLFDDGDCLAGDAAAAMLRFAGTKHCVIFVTDLDQYYASWEKLLAAGAKRIFPAHGKPFPAEKLRADMGRNKAENIVSRK